MEQPDIGGSVGEGRGGRAGTSRTQRVQQAGDPWCLIRVKRDLARGVAGQQDPDRVGRPRREQFR
ncbi:MAG: hypothetical protein ABSB59_12655 [Streptosporangiaceae bacterium]